jgi:hypothetical protein
MVSSRALLLLVAALALPFSVITGCGDDSDPKEEEPSRDESPGDDDDVGGEQGDARVSRMDGSIVKSDAGGDDKPDSGEVADAGGEVKLDASITTSDSGTQDAKIEGIDASIDAGKADAKVDSASPDADAGNEEEDASEPEEDAGNDAGTEDAAQQDSGETDAGQTDAGEEYTDAQCDEAGGEKKDDDEDCGANETEFDLVGDQICCVPNDPEPTPDGTCGGVAGIPCKDGEFCDTSKLGGGEGCGVADGQGKCRAVPDMCNPGVFAPGCGCNGVLYVDVCAAYAQKVPVESCVQ